MLLLGAHMSIAGGIDKAVDHALSVDSDAVQIFTKNQRQWKAKPLEAAVVELCKKKYCESGLRGVVAHNSYLINLASQKEDLLAKSVDAMRDELERCEQLGVPFLVAHPGSHTGAGREAGLDRIVQSFDEIHAALPGYAVRTLLETTAGQGTNLGSTFEDLAYLLERVAEPERLGVCLDTCHVFAAGYDIRTPDTYEATMAEFNRIIGIKQLEALHFNDSKFGLGSKKDRHELIGKGEIGEIAFRCLMNDPRLDGKPALLETEKGEDLAEDRAAIILLRSLVDQA
jgi:deoxyribonuclease IV